MRAYQKYFRTLYRIKKKLPGYHEWDVQLTKRQNVCAATAIDNAATTNNKNKVPIDVPRYQTM